MALGQFTVIIHPHHGDHSLDELARRVASLNRASAPAILRALERGPMTLEAELSEDAARRLLDRLQKMNIPAYVRDETTGDELARSLPEPPTETNVDAPHVSSSPAPESPNHGSLVALIEPNSLARDEVPARPSTSSPEDPPQGITIPGWDTVFPGIDPSAAEPPSLDDLELAPPSPTSHRRTSHDDPPDLAPPRPVAPSIPASDASPTSPPPRALEPGPLGHAPTSATRAPALFHETGSTHDRRPYAPKGFDDRPDHSPGIARALSIIAPGAGQIYNGDDDQALHYGLRFFLLIPWWDSVRDATDLAQKIHDHRAQRPAEGSLLRALRYTLGFWIAAGGVAFLAAAAFHAAQTSMQRPVEPIVDHDAIAASIDEARMTITEAGIHSLDAVAEAHQALARDRFTMSDDERAERLFLLGVTYCRAGQYSRCEATMRKVTSLKPRHRDAFRLQTWASARRSGATLPMPKLDHVATLEEFEIDLFQKEQAALEPTNPNPDASSAAALPSPPDNPAPDAPDASPRSSTPPTPAPDEAPDAP